MGDHMVVVGIRELKAKLSSYLDQVRRGNTVIVTDHGDEVALIVEVPPDRKAVLSLVAAGRAHWSPGKPKGHKGARLKGKPLSRTILDERT